jgi:hypothetical protein
MENKVAIVFHPSSCTSWKLSIGSSLKTAVLDIPAKKLYG